MHRSFSLRVAATAAAVGLMSAPVAGPAFAADSTYTVHLRQSVPRTAAGAEGGDSCPGVPAGMDGWHFVLPTNDAHFVKLTVTFEPGGQQVVTSFGPPSDKHAYVASAPGAKLTSAVAEVSGGHLDLFNLSHTCPAVSNGSPSPTPTTAPPSTPPATPSASPSTSASGSASPSGTPSAGPSPSGSTSTSASPSAGASSPAGSVPSPSSSPSTGPTAGGLAFTGADVAGIVAGGVLLIGVGAVLVMRRRKAATGEE